MDTWKGQLRAILATYFGYLISKGLATPDQVEQLITLILSGAGVVGVMIWSWMSKSITNVLDHVAKSPEVEKVIVNDPELAVAVPSNKVVSDVSARGF